MPTPTGPQFIQLYRGLEGVSPETLDTHQMGSHWTTDRDVARNFSGADWEGTQGTIVSAKVHKRHIIPEGTEEHDSAMSRTGVMPSDEPWGRYEKEHTVRSGAPLHITEIQHLPEEGGSMTTERKDMSIKDLRRFRA